MCGRWWLSLKSHCEHSGRAADGQASVETLILLPLILFIGLAVWQLLWLAWQAHTLQVASSYAARAGAIANGSKGKMEATLVSYLSSTDLSLLTSEQRPNLMRASQQQLLQRVAFKRLGRLTIITPTRLQQQDYQQDRVRYQSSLGGVLRAQRWQEIPVDHAAARLAKIAPKGDDKVQAWLAARQLTIDVVWCVPLKVPIAGKTIAALATWFDQNAAQLAATRTCALRQSFSQAPLWPLQHRLSTPMLSGFHTASPS